MGKKPESQKDLVKLSLDTQEEARELRDAGNLESAVVKYQEALRYHTSPSIHQELGGVLADLNRFPEARKQYELALLENPGMREAEVALEELDAQIELAEVDRLSPATSGGGTRMGEYSVADTSSRERSTDSFEFMDEEAAFREMSEYTPAGAPPVNSVRGEGSTSGSDLAKDARDLFGVGEDNLDLGYSSETANSFGSDNIEFKDFGSASPSFSPSPSQTASSPIAPTKSALGGRKPLPGGRGLIHGGGLVTQVVASGPPMTRSPAPNFDLNNDLSFDSTRAGTYNSLDGQQIASTAGAGPITPRGGRGLGTTSRLPAEKQADTVRLEERSFGTYTSVSPPGGRPVADISVDTPDLERNPDLPTKSDGFLSADPIVYPTPQPKPGSTVIDPLPAPGFEKEVLDISGSSFSDRFKGRRAATFDLEACKKRFYEEGDLEGAIRCFRDKRIDFPESSELHYELGKIYETSGQYPLAREEYLLAIRYSPNRQEYKQALASVEVGQARKLVEEGKYLAASEILIQTVERFPNMAPAYRELAKAYSKSAFSREQELAASGLESPDVRAAIATEWRRAEASYRKLLDISGGNYKDWYNYGVAIQSQYDDTKDRLAINAYEKTLEMNPTFWDAHYNVAILYESKNPQKALYHYEEALTLARTDTGPLGKSRRVQCLGALGELYWRTDQTEKAADYLTEYMRLVPDDENIEQILEQITSAPAIRN